MRLVLLQYCSRVTTRMQTSLTWLVCVIALFVVWQISVSYSRHAITWHLHAVTTAAAAPLVSLLACMFCGARANLQHAKHSNILVQHRLMLRTTQASHRPVGASDPVDDLLQVQRAALNFRSIFPFICSIYGQYSRATNINHHSRLVVPPQVGSEMVRNTDFLTCLGFDATQEVFKATVSALATVIVVGVSLLGSDTLSRAGQAASFSPGVGGR